MDTEAYRSCPTSSGNKGGRQNLNPGTAAPKYTLYLLGYMADTQSKLRELSQTKDY